MIQLDRSFYDFLKIELHDLEINPDALNQTLAECLLRCPAYVPAGRDFNDRMFWVDEILRTAFFYSSAQRKELLNLILQIGAFHTGQHEESPLIELVMTQLFGSCGLILSREDSLPREIVEVDENEAQRRIESISIEFTNFICDSPLLIIDMSSKAVTKQIQAAQAVSEQGTQGVKYPHVFAGLFDRKVYYEMFPKPEVSLPLAFPSNIPPPATEFDLIQLPKTFRAKGVKDFAGVNAFSLFSTPQPDEFASTTVYSKPNQLEDKESESIFQNMHQSVIDSSMSASQLISLSEQMRQKTAEQLHQEQLESQRILQEQQQQAESLRQQKLQEQQAELLREQQAEQLRQQRQQELQAEQLRQQKLQEQQAEQLRQQKLQEQQAELLRQQKLLEQQAEELRQQKLLEQQAEQQRLQKLLEQQAELLRQQQLQEQLEQEQQRLQLQQQQQLLQQQQKQHIVIQQENQSQQQQQDGILAQNQQQQDPVPKVKKSLRVPTTNQTAFLGLSSEPQPNNPGQANEQLVQPPPPPAISIDKSLPVSLKACREFYLSIESTVHSNTSDSLAAHTSREFKQLLSSFFSNLYDVTFKAAIINAFLSSCENPHHQVYYEYAVLQQFQKQIEDKDSMFFVGGQSFPYIINVLLFFYNRTSLYSLFIGMLANKLQLITLDRAYGFIPKNLDRASLQCYLVLQILLLIDNPNFFIDIKARHNNLLVKYVHAEVNNNSQHYQCPVNLKPKFKICFDHPTNEALKLKRDSQSSYSEHILDTRIPKELKEYLLTVSFLCNTSSIIQLELLFNPKKTQIGEDEYPLVKVLEFKREHLSRLSLAADELNECLKPVPDACLYLAQERKVLAETADFFKQQLIQFRLYSGIKIPNLSLESLPDMNIVHEYQSLKISADKIIKKFANVYDGNETKTSKAKGLEEAKQAITNTFGSNAKLAELILQYTVKIVNEKEADADADDFYYIYDALFYISLEQKFK